MFKAVSRSVRPTLTKEFWVWDEDMNDYVNEEYVQSGKLLEVSTELLDNDKEQQVVYTFSNKESCNEYFQDPVIKFQEKIKLKYNLYHEIAYSLNTTGTATITRSLYTLYKR
jgi:hypothetical protein